jgi:diaminopimelate decarboxylase
MNHFTYRGGELYAEDVPLREIARRVGTPFYCYSRATLVRHFRVYDEAFRDIPHLVCYSVKANSNLAVLRVLALEGAGADIVSAGELRRALDAGISPRKVVFSGVGKTEEEIALALHAGILMFNVESEGELEAIARVAKGERRVAPISIRINPDIDPHTHPYIATGLKKSKFGISVEAARAAYARARELSTLEVVGIDCHIGSQLLKVEPFGEALRRTREFAEELRADGHLVRYLDLGGGLGIPYSDEEPPLPQELASHLARELQGFEVTLVLEPGRVVVGNAGVLVTKVLYLKHGADKRFVIVDAAMNDLIRPSLYGSHHEVLPVRETPPDEATVDVVGPICESGDFLAQERRLPRLSPGDLLAVMSAGAYGFSMSSNYNARPRAAEVLVHGEKFWVVRRRETYEDLTRGEKIPDFLQAEPEAPGGDGGL